ncbi:MAG TPA: ComEC/Rec2 family competence protein [Hyphomicrobiales bacterium]|nr:ComEC/Rec2 family competence protein [Hyphomicrobiales bacterium]
MDRGGGQLHGRFGAAAVAVAGAAIGRRTGSPAISWAALPGALGSALTEEAAQGRLGLWLPVAAIGGIALFFSASTDPSLPAAAAALGVCAALAFLARRRPVALPLLAGATAVAAGFFACTLRVALVAAPILPHTFTGEAVGTVETVEPGAGRERVVIRPESLAGVATAALPYRLRVTIRGRHPLEAGDRIAVDTRWHPPPGPALPGGYDFARDAFFDGLGGLGESTSKLRLLPAAPATLPQRFQNGVDRLRNAITARILAVVPGPRGAISASMVTGERAGIPEAMNADMRTAGIYHVISISGLHMALVAGGVFFVLRLILVMIPGLALRYPVKKWAAGAAIAVAAGYLILSGNEVATQRSFIMIALVLIAVAFDRAALTLRNVAVSAVLVLAFTPEAAIGPSFQMSYAAVVALVAWYQRRRARPPAPAPKGPVGRAARWLAGHLGGAAVTTILAGFATAPAAAFHFQRLSAYGLAANVGTLPLISFVIMPAVIVGIVLMPFGLDAVAWMAMAWGVDGMMAVAHAVASWPGASRHVVAFGPAAMVLMTLALLWLALFATRLRWLAVVPLVLGLWLAATATAPDVFVEPEGRAVAVRAPDGQLHVIGIRFDGFAVDEWLAATGDGRTHRDRALAAGIRCDSLGCTAPLPDGRFLAADWSYAALREDCGRAAIVVTRLAVRAGCRAHTFVIDGRDLASGGAHALRLGPGGIEATVARPPWSSRRWYDRPVPPTPPPADAAPKPATPDDADDEPVQVERPALGQ